MILMTLFHCMAQSKNIYVQFFEADYETCHGYNC